MFFKKLKSRMKAIATALLVLSNFIFVLILPLSYSVVAGLILINLICILLGGLAVLANKKVVSLYSEMLSVYPTKKNYRVCDTRNYDVANLGGSEAKQLFDYHSAGIKGLNWAQTSQPLKYDFLILKNFHSVLKKNGAVILTISMESILPAKTEDRRSSFYARFIDPLLLSNDVEFSKTADQIRREKYPLLFDFRNSIKMLLNSHIKPAKQKIPESSCEKLEERGPDAFNWEHDLKEKSAVINEIIDFCETRGLKLVFLFLQNDLNDGEKKGFEIFRRVLETTRNDAQDRNIQVIYHPAQDSPDSRGTKNSSSCTETDPAAFTKNIFNAITQRPYT